MPSTVGLAEFATEVSYQGLPADVREAAKRRVLDAVGVGVGRVEDPAMAAIRRTVAVQNAAGRSRLWGSDGSVAPPDAARYNAALVASGNGAVYLAPTVAPAHGTVAPVLAIAEARSVGGENLLAGLAVAHEVHGELAWHAPLDGFHPATHCCIAAAAGAGRALEFDAEELASAIGLAASHAVLAVDGEAFDPLAVGGSASDAVESCLLAENGVVGPDAIERPDGWTDIVGPFDLDLDPGCERVTDAAFLPYDAHPYAQSAVEAAIDLADEAALDPADVDAVAVETFADAVAAVEPRSIAAALVDRELTIGPGERTDLDPVAATVEVTEAADLTGRTDNGDVPARVTVECRDGSVRETEVQWFTGHPSAPESWGTVVDKFHELAGDRYDEDRREAVVETVRGLEAETAAELSRLLD